jgi:hypothetical protein
MSEIFNGRVSPMKGKKQSDEAKEKIGNSVRERWKRDKENGITYSGWKHKKVECPFCGKIGGEGLMKRWHFNNCKNKK